jgi:hypothetical protein
MKLFNFKAGLRLARERDGTKLPVLCQAGSFAAVFVPLSSVLLAVAKTFVEGATRQTHAEPLLYIEPSVFAAVTLILLPNLRDLSSIAGSGVRGIVVRRRKGAGEEQ